MDFQTVLAEVKQVLPKVDLDPSKDAKPLLDEIVKRSGLLLAIDGGERYQFAHLTLQEFFAAEALVNDEQGLLARFRDDPDGWREVVKLWCGLGIDCTALVRGVPKQIRWQRSSAWPTRSKSTPSCPTGC